LIVAAACSIAIEGSSQSLAVASANTVGKTIAAAKQVAVKKPVTQTAQRKPLSTRRPSLGSLEHSRITIAHPMAMLRPAPMVFAPGRDVRPSTLAGRSSTQAPETIGLVGSQGDEFGMSGSPSGTGLGAATATRSWSRSTIPASATGASRGLGAMFDEASRGSTGIGLMGSGFDPLLVPGSITGAAGPSGYGR
jgi:hypothetical protein